MVPTTNFTTQVPPLVSLTTIVLALVVPTIVSIIVSKQFTTLKIILVYYSTSFASKWNTMLIDNDNTLSISIFEIGTTFG